VPKSAYIHRRGGLLPGAVTSALRQNDRVEVIMALSQTEPDFDALAAE